MKIRVSATRMELMKLKKRLTLAVRGHRLLKDKQDELVRQFFLRQEKYRLHLKELWKVVISARDSFGYLRGTASRPAIHLACHTPRPSPTVELGNERVVNLSVPVYRLATEPSEPLFGLLDCAGPLENVLEDYRTLILLLIRKAEMEKALTAILGEIEVTKRRVNALEYKLIPSLRESISSITSKLSELELSNLMRLMRVKDIINQQQPDRGPKTAPGINGVSAQ